MKLAAQFLIAILFATVVADQTLIAEEFVGTWRGELVKNGYRWSIELHVDKGESGHQVQASFPDWGMFRLSCSNIKLVEGALLFDVQWLDAPARIQADSDLLRISLGEKEIAEGILHRSDSRAWQFATEPVKVVADDGAELSGTLLLPHSEPPYPAMVLTHGSGPDTRITGPYLGKANLAVESGIAVLIYDKRGAGESTNPGGKFVSLDRLVKDAHLMIEQLRNHQKVDQDWIGVGGISQGAWVAPKVAFDDPEIAFVFTTATPGLTPAEQNVFTLETRLRSSGIEEDEIDQGKHALRTLYEYYRTGRAEVKEEAKRLIIEGERNWTESPIFKRLMFSDGKILESVNPQDWSSLFVEPLHWWREIKSYVAVFSGAEDLNIPTTFSHAVIEAALIDAGNERYTIRSFPDAGHGLSLNNLPDGDWPRMAPSFIPEMKRWFQGIVREQRSR